MSVPGKTITFTYVHEHSYFRIMTDAIFNTSLPKRVKKTVVNIGVKNVIKIVFLSIIVPSGTNTHVCHTRM
jgi:hypothetical protein